MGQYSIGPRLLCPRPPDKKNVSLLIKFIRHGGSQSSLRKSTPLPVGLSCIDIHLVTTIIIYL